MTRIAVQGSSWLERPIYMNKCPSYHRLTRMRPGVGYLLSAAAILSCAMTTALATDGIEPIGLSTQSIIRGGSDVAVGDSALDQINNPATLTQVGRSLDLSGELFMPHTHWNNSVDGDISRLRHLPLGHIGLSIPVDRRFTYGVTIWSKSLLGTDFKLRLPTDTFNRHQSGVDLRDFGLGLNASIQVTDKLSLGFGARTELATTKFKTTLSTIDLDFKRGWSLGGGFQLGAMYQVTPEITLGLGYRSPTWFPELLGEGSRSTMTNEWTLSVPGFTVPVPIGSAVIENIVLPQRLAAGATWQATDKLRLTTEGRWINYDNSTMNRCDFAVDGPIGFNVRTPIAYRDLWAAMAGAEYKLTNMWTVGCGYHFACNPIDPGYFLPIADMITQHHISVGTTLRTKQWWLGGGYLIGLPHSMSAPSTIDFPQRLVTSKQDMRQAQHSLFVGMGFNW